MHSYCCTHYKVKMRIRAFSKNVELLELKPFSLKNCTVVIDGQNYFYNLYHSFNLHFAFGCEADKYAKCLRKHLSMFKEANVKCYFVFKGGHEDLEKRLNYDKISRGKLFNVNDPIDEVLPPFMKSVYKAVLRELKMDYVICLFESKRQCVALAQKLKCPIISQDVEFCFSGVPYIPRGSMNYDAETREIYCGIFHFEAFKKKYTLSNEKIAIFIALTDENIFPEGRFEQFFLDEKLRRGPFKRNQALLQWLQRKSQQEVQNKLSRYLNTDDLKKYSYEIEKLVNFICRIETPGIPANYLLKGKSIDFTENDPDWFEKGVVSENIAIEYVNLHYVNKFFGSWCIEDLEADDAMLLSQNIIVYAFNLLTNFQKDKLLFNDNKGEIQEIDVKSDIAIRKPSYEAQSSPFENGWEHVKSLKLFEHFIEESLQGVNHTALDTLPNNVKLFVLALVYFSRQKSVNVELEVYSILLSYVMLGVVFEKLNDTLKDSSKMEKKPILDSFTDNNLVTEVDCEVAKSLCEEYFILPSTKLPEIFDRKLIHAFVEFQHCLQHLNNLNKMCGLRYEPTTYHKAYNATFVYQFFYTLKDMSRDAAMTFIENKLCPAPTVLAFFNGLVEAYETIMYR